MLKKERKTKGGKILENRTMKIKIKEEGKCSISVLHRVEEA
jgi:hypothetical protein